MIKKVDDEPDDRDIESYWINRDFDSVFSCPNVSLFRLIGGAFGSLSKKKVLEVGFASGADLIECKRRGAEVYGLDINPKFVVTLTKNHKFDVRQFRAGINEIPFNQKFDLIYSRDTICYLTNKELEQFFNQCNYSLNDKGTMIVQFIETDLKLRSKKKKKFENFNVSFLSNYEVHQIHSDENPVRFLAVDSVINLANRCNFVLKHSKIMLQSYDLHEHEIRVDKYLVFDRA